MQRYVDWGVSVGMCSVIWIGLGCVSEDVQCNVDWIGLCQLGCGCNVDWDGLCWRIGLGWVVSVGMCSVMRIGLGFVIWDVQCNVDWVGLCQLGRVV